MGCVLQEFFLVAHFGLEGTRLAQPTKGPSNVYNFLTSKHYLFAGFLCKPDGVLRSLRNRSNVVRLGHHKSEERTQIWTFSPRHRVALTLPSSPPFPVVHFVARPCTRHPIHLPHRRESHVPPSTMACSRSIFGALLLALVAMLQGAAAWENGRATFYGNEPHLWSIHHGSCGKGYQWPDQGTGWDIVALSDTYKGYAGSCGRCYEVKCQNNGFKDGYGNWIDRKGMCRDTEASVVVTVTDTCPCQYANNYYSNKRWCCGDMNHMDLSVWAFQKLTDMKWGVIPIQYRQVDCGFKPSKQAYGASFPGEFPAKADANQRSSDFYYKYFPNGGYLNSKRGDGGKQVSVQEYLSMAGVSGGKQYGK